MILQTGRDHAGEKKGGNMTGIDLLGLLLGIVLLILGRKFFWLFVGIIGFITGFTLASNLLRGQPDWLILLIGVVVGVIGAGLAVVLQRLAVAVAGFMAGGYLALALLQQLGTEVVGMNWLPFIIGGVVGAIFMFVFFDWGLIILSSIIGANLIVQALPVASPLNLVLLIVLVIVGIVLQAGLMSREHGRTPVAPV